MVEKMQGTEENKEEPMETEAEAPATPKEEETTPDKAAGSPKKKDAGKEQATTNDEVGFRTGLAKYVCLINFAVTGEIHM